MSKALDRIELFLKQAEEKINKTENSNDRVLQIYASGIRTEMFMLQGLFRIYKSGFSKKSFEKLLIKVKQVEDALGAIDYYDGFVKVFQADSTTPPEMISNLNFRRSQCMQNLEVILKDNGWMAKGKDNRFQKIRKRLNKIDWPKDKKESGIIEAYYLDEIKDIEDFVASEGLPFTKMEEQVHEYRRKLRWLSIYPAALQGKIKLLELPFTDERLAKYRTDEIMNSPYNQFPKSDDEIDYVYLDKNKFYAVSWLIAKLGLLKDNGLQYYAIAEALKMQNKISDAEAISQALKITGNENKLNELLAEASKDIMVFQDEECLHNLVISH